MNGTRRLFIWIAFLCALGLGYPIWRKLTKVSRYPLPYEDIEHWASLASEHPGCVIKLDVTIVQKSPNVSKEEETRRLEYIQKELSLRLSSLDKSKMPEAFKFEVNTIISRKNQFSTEDWKIINKGDPQATDSLLQSKGLKTRENREGHYNIYVFVFSHFDDEKERKQFSSAYWGIHRHAWMRVTDWDVTKEAEDEVVPTLIDLVDTHLVPSVEFRWTPVVDITSVLTSSSTTESSSSSSSSSEQTLSKEEQNSMQEERKRIDPSACAAPISQAYHLSFSLLNANPGDGVYSWEFEDAFGTYLRPMISLIDATTANITVDSQVVHYASFEKPPEYDEEHEMWYYTKETLPFFIQPYAWASDFTQTARIHLNFMIYVPSLQYTPLTIRFDNGSYSDLSAYILEREAGIIVYNRNKSSHPQDHNIDVKEMHHFIAIFITQLRKLLGISPGEYTPVVREYTHSTGDKVEEDETKDIVVQEQEKEKEKEKEKVEEEKKINENGEKEKEEEENKKKAVEITEMEEEVVLSQHQEGDEDKDQIEKEEKEELQERNKDEEKNKNENIQKKEDNKVLPIVLLPNKVTAVSTWELDAFKRFKTLEQYRSAVYTLNSLVKLLRNQTMMPVTESVGPKVDASLEALQSCNVALSNSEWSKAHEYSSLAIKEAEGAFYDPSMSSLFHYPPEHEFAIYVPHFVPVGVSIVRAFVMEIFVGLAALWVLLAPKLTKWIWGSSNSS